MALAIGANTAIFSLARQLLYERLAVPHASDLRLLAWAGPEDDLAIQSIWASMVIFLAKGYEQCVFLSGLSAAAQPESRNGGSLRVQGVGMNATIEGNAEPVQAELVSGNYYGDLNVKPVLGRAILPSDDGEPGRSAVAVISDGLWERKFGRSRAGAWQGGEAQRYSVNDCRSESERVYWCGECAAIP